MIKSLLRKKQNILFVLGCISIFSLIGIISFKYTHNNSSINVPFNSFENKQNSLFQVDKLPVATGYWINSFQKLRWDRELNKFVYSTQQNPYDIKSIETKTFDPLTKKKELIEEEQYKIILSENLKKKLGITQLKQDDEVVEYIDVSPSGENIVFLKFKIEAGEGETVYQYVDVWRAKSNGSSPQKLGSIVGPFNAVYWLDNEETVIVTVPLVTGEEFSQFSTRKVSPPDYLQNKVFEKCEKLPNELTISPDETWLAVNCSQPDNKYTLFLINREIGNIKMIGSSAYLKPLWGEESKYIYYLQEKEKDSNDYSIIRYDLESEKNEVLIESKQLKKTDIRDWVKSSTDKFFLFSIENSTISNGLENGIWLLDLKDK